MPVDAQAAVDLLKELRSLTSDEHGAQRLAWSPVWLKARSWFESKLRTLPVEHHYDAAGNSWSTLAGSSEKTLILGSHIDSVPNGGWLDGCLGVIGAYAVLRRIAEEYKGKPPVTVRLVDWADEEGARFGRSLFGSSAFAGTQTIDQDRGRTDAGGKRLEDALAECGVSIDKIGDAGRERKNAAAYLELHIEQGPVLGEAWASVGRSARHQRRGAPHDHIPRAGGALRLHAHDGAARCAGCRRKAGSGNSPHRQAASRRGMHHGQRQDFSRHCDRGRWPLRGDA
jgi:hydantoinase/carbamoylase family amidase